MQSLDKVPTFSGRFRETYVIKPVQLEQITQNFCYTVNDGSNEKVVEQKEHSNDDELPSNGAPLNEIPSNGAGSVTLSDEEKTFYEPIFKWFRLKEANEKELKPAEKSIYYLNGEIKM